MDIPLQQHLRPMMLPALPPDPLVSILVSNFNYAHFASEAIESALGQSYSNVEFILCDDGSTDNSLEVFSHYAQQDSRIRVIAKENGGHSTGLNSAYGECKGEIICFLDTDDVYMKDKIELVVRTFQASSTCGCVVHRLSRVDARRRPRGVQPLFAYLPDGWYGHALLKNGGVLDHMPGTLGLNFRREITEMIFPLPVNPPLNICPDMVLFRVAPLFTEIAAIPTPLAEVRQHGRNTYVREHITSASIRRELDICEHLWKVQRDFLVQISPGIGARFGPLELSPTILMHRYLLAKLSGDLDAPNFLRKFLETQKPVMRCLWSALTYLPKPLFKVAINRLFGQSRLKQFLGKVLFFLRRSRRPRSRRRSAPQFPNATE
jgi:glycosyltransferase involved in cell wall biosynthesis